MKRIKLVIITLLFLSPTISKAQYVTIPNQGFVNFLQYTFPSCMSGNMMDTTWNNIIAAITAKLTKKPVIENSLIKEEIKKCLVSLQNK